MTFLNPTRAAPKRSNRGVSRKAARKARDPQAPNLYEQVTARIITELEAGRLPWVQPWGSPGQASGSAVGPALPRNALTGRPYSGVNILLLWSEVIAMAYPSQGWLTFKQALEAGGNVRKGERGTCVVYADRFVPEAEKVRARESGEEAKAIPFLKRFTLFNVAQCEGLQSGLVPDPVPLPEREIVPVAEAVIAASGVDFRVGGDKAYYMPSLDVVQVPPQPAFFHQINFYRTCLHELTHSTGHKTRLARDLSNSFGSAGYAREELAEMGSAFLCASLGIVPTVRHADYVGAWVAVLREDSRAIFRAARAASLGADWLLERHAQAKADGSALGDVAGAGAGEPLQQGRAA